MVRSFVFAEGKLVEKDMDLSTLPILLKDEGVHVWVDLENPSPEESREILEKTFQFHPLAIDDCLAVSQLPKVEDYEGYIFLVFHAVDFEKKSEQFHTTELDLFLGKNFVVTWHREPISSLRATLDRCSRGANAARGSDRIAHHILDALVDNYMPVLFEFGEDVNEVENIISEGHNLKHLAQRVTDLKKEINHLASVIRPQVEILNRLARGEFKVIRSVLLPYYRDIRDHLTRYNTMTDAFRDSLNGTLQLYLSLSANHTNDTVKVLTMITVITTPMSIISSWYGMNFRNMPEIDSHWGYFIALTLTAISTLGCYLWFRKRGWM